MEQVRCAMCATLVPTTTTTQTSHIVLAHSKHASPASTYFRAGIVLPALIWIVGQPLTLAWPLSAPTRVSIVRSRHSRRDTSTTATFPFYRVYDRSLSQLQSQPQPLHPYPEEAFDRSDDNCPLQVLYHDINSRYLVVNKPASIVCHHSEWTGSRAKTEQPQIPVLQRVRDQMGRRVNLVHRLDRGASGCLLLTYADDVEPFVKSSERYIDDDDDDDDKGRITSRNNHAGNDNDNIYDGATPALMNSTVATSTLIQAMANSTTCTKTYIALVRGEGILHGVDLKQQGWFLVDRAIANERGVVKNATTWFRFVAGQDNGAGTIDRARATVVLARPTTGRWHQIRKHLNGLSHPILGDSTHGSSRINREWREQRGLPLERTCLHLARLQIGPTPLCPQGIDVRCSLAPDMMQILHDHLPAVLAAAEPILREEGIQL